MAYSASSARTVLKGITLIDHTTADHDDLTHSNLHEKGAATNRRVFKRRNARWRCTLQTIKNATYVGMTGNVSEQGVQVNVETNLSPATLIKVEIDSYYQGKRRLLTAIGEVMHSSINSAGFTLGIHLSKMSALSAAFLKQYANSDI